MHVDDFLVFYKDKSMLDDLIKSMEDSFKFTVEGDLVSCLGMKFKKLGTSSFKMSQPHLITRIIEMLGLDDNEK